MEIREGYKKTEVGVIPEDWILDNFGSITSKIGSGITPTGGSRIYKKTGRPFVRSQNVLNAKMNLADIAFIDEETHKTFEGTEIQNEDVLLNITGASIGRSAVAERSVIGGNVNQHVCILRPIKDRVNPLYLCSYILSAKGQKYIDDFQSGGNRQGLNFKQIATIKIPIPSLLEQHAIATVQSDIEGLISSLTKLIDKKKNIMQGSMQELLTGRKRLEGFRGSIDYVSLISLCDIFCDGDWIESKDQSDNGYRLIQTGNVGIGRYLDKSSKKRYISGETFERLNCTKILKNDVLVSRLPEPAGRACLVPNTKEPMITAVDCTIIRFHDYNSVLFINYTRTTEYQKQIDMMLGGSTRQRISRKELGEVLVPVFPSEKEQILISNILSDMNAEIDALEQKLNNSTFPHGKWL